MQFSPSPAERGEGAGGWGPRRAAGSLPVTLDPGAPLNETAPRTVQAHPAMVAWMARSVQPALALDSPKFPSHPENRFG